MFAPYFHPAMKAVAQARAALGVRTIFNILGPLANPANYFDATFQAQAGTRYRVWLRMHPIGDTKWNDSVFVQFSDAAGASYAIASDERMDPTQEGVPELWWVVDDVNAAFAEMSKKGKVSMPLQQKPFGTCFGVKDPSGQVHYVLEFAQQRPSQQVG